MISQPHSWKSPDLWTCLYFLGHGIIHILDIHVSTTLKFQKQMWQYRFFQRRVKGGRGSVNINMSDLRLILISSLCALGRGVERHGEVPVGVLWPGISCPVRIMPAAEPAGPVESSRNPHCSMLSAHTSRRGVWYWPPTSLTQRKHGLTSCFCTPKAVFLAHIKVKTTSSESAEMCAGQMNVNLHKKSFLMERECGSNRCILDSNPSRRWHPGRYTRGNHIADIQGTGLL